MKSFRPVFIVGCLLLLLSAVPLNAATYYVAQRHPAASDENAGTEALPWKTISRAATGSELKPGDTVRIDTGIYRERVVVAKSGTAARPIRFSAAIAANVVVTGADSLTQWQKEPGEANVFSAAWPHRFLTWSKTGTHPSDNYHRLIGRPEQVAVLGYPLRQVLSRAELARGTFFADTEAKRLHVWTTDDRDVSKDGVAVEASVRGTWWESTGDYVHLRGIRFRYAANQAQQGAAQFSGKGNVIEDCVFEMANSSGAAFRGASGIVRRCTFQDNGQLGFGANRAHGTLFTECVVRNNNTKNFNRGWEAGGDKLAFCRNVVLEKCQFLNNRGTGIWFDIGNENCVVRNCLIADNEDAGIFYEISYGLHAHDNVIVGNGLADYPGSWGANSGIALSSSPNCVIERNLLIGNKEGFALREQRRTTPLIDDPKERAVWNHDQTVRNNVIAYNRDAQTWGWFDVNDERHWPKSLHQSKPEGGAVGADIAAEYGAKDDKGQPVGLTLEKLNLVFTGNLYSVRASQELFHWGVLWKRNERFANLADVARTLKLEQGSRVAPFVFADYLTRDFRVPADSPALAMKCYPEGQVPGTSLGILKAQ